ncbi:MAG: glycerophosphodiester phosphodiesterase [Dictyoglomus sp. NZ13-RE01]|nr:MAG: glycerophosphodiester phosphodiesterase [Dictyoglomus sp. NZ13-RE01]
MLVLGHRGNSYNPENTLKAFKSSIEMGADGVELDVQKTADGVLIVSHDENLKRLTGIDINVRRTEFSKLKNVTINGEPIATLKDALELIKSHDKFVDIEVKNPKDFQDVIDLVKEIKLKDFIISSFWHNGVFEYKKLYPEIKFAYLYAHSPRDLSVYVKEVDYLKPHFYYINEDYAPYRDRTIAWTVDDEEKIKEILDFKIFAIISNFPDRVIKIMKGGKEMYSNPYLSYFLQMIDKKSMVQKENHISFEAINYMIPLRIENLSMDDGEIKLNKDLPFNWGLGDRVRFEINIKGENPKVNIKVREVGELSFSLKEILKLL